jgi:hypothetical protein
MNASASTSESLALSTPTPTPTPTHCQQATTQSTESSLRIILAPKVITLSNDNGNGALLPTSASPQVPFEVREQRAAGSTLRRFPFSLSQTANKIHGRCK